MGLIFETPGWGRVRGGGWPRVLADGTRKEFFVELHALRRFGHGLQRDFSFWFVWRAADGTEVWRRRVGISIHKTKGLRWDFRLKCPVCHRSRTLHHVAARLKEGRLTTLSMSGRDGDHIRGYGGWRTLLWDVLRSVPAGCG